MRSVLRLLGGVLLVVLAAAGLAEDRYLMGSVTYREKIALSPKAIIRVTVEDVGIADRAAPIIGTQSIPANGKQVPFVFSIKFDSSQVQAGGSYGVRAQIFEGKKLLFTSTAAFPVRLDGTDAAVQVVVSQASTPPPNEIESAAKWTLYELNGVQWLEQTERDLELTFNSERHRFGAYGGVNQIGGEYTLEGTKIKFFEIFSTLRAGPAGLMKQEKAFMDMLNRATKAKRFGNRLVLYHKNKAIAKFKG